MLQLVIGLSLIWYEAMLRYSKRCIAVGAANTTAASDAAATAAADDASAATFGNPANAFVRLGGRCFLRLAHLLSDDFGELHQKHSKWKASNPIRCAPTPYIFTSHKREMANFCRLNTDAEYRDLPGTPMEVESGTDHRAQLKHTSRPHDRML